MLRLSLERVTMEKITRFGVSIEPELLKAFDRMIKKEGYINRSEAIRDLIRKNILTDKLKDLEMNALGTLSITYDHHTGSLTNRLLDIEHDHHTEILTTTHLHIDHNNCLEVLILKGKIGKIQNLANDIKSLKGIKHGELVVTRTTL